MSKDFDNKWKVFIEQEIPELGEEIPKPSDKQIQMVEDLLKNLLVVVAAAATPEVNEGRLERRKKRREINTVNKRKKIKSAAGLAGIDLKNFTPEQLALYRQARAELRTKDENEQNLLFLQTFGGNALDIEIVKQQLDKGGQPLKLALAAVFTIAGFSDCVDNLNITCLVTALNKMPQGGM